MTEQALPSTASTIALVAHDRKKDDIVVLAREHKALLSKYRLIATGTTGQRIQAGTQLNITAKQSGPLGGDAEIATEVVNGHVVAVIFLIDPLYAQPHEPDIRALLRICEVYDVPLATNVATAKAVLATLGGVRVGHLIFNPVSGQGDPQQQLRLIRQHLAPQIQLRVHVTEPGDDPGAIARSAVAAGADLVIASGGDGTVSTVAGALMETEVPLGVLPRGTANAFAVAMGIPTDLPGACDVLLAGLTQTVDAARCNGKPMILLAGFGFEAETVERANREAKDRWGALAYILAGIQQFGEQQPFEAELEVDEDKVTTVQAVAITVANAAPPTSILAQGSGKVIASDGLLDITIGTSATKFQAFNALIDLMGAALVKGETRREDIVRLQARRIKVTTNPGQKVVVDGDLLNGALDAPIEVICYPKSLRVLAPPSQD
jgi:diacylglycerol kinase (ATP)